MKWQWAKQRQRRRERLSNQMQDLEDGPTNHMIININSASTSSSFHGSVSDDKLV